ncbi:MAG: hypothetical protein IJ193_00885 [Bacilli bacterium]|nr:hypothetical protein [Bacilli bacterium]
MSNNNQYKIVAVERYGDTVLTNKKYTSVLEDAREIYENYKLNLNIVDVSIWYNDTELERYTRNK